MANRADRYTLRAPTGQALAAKTCQLSHALSTRCHYRRIHL